MEKFENALGKPSQEDPDYGRYYRDLPQSFNPDERAKDAALIKSLEEEFDESIGQKLAGKSLDAEMLARMKDDFVHNGLRKKDHERVSADADALDAIAVKKMDEGRSDQLTGLGNRKEFFRFVDIAFRRAFRLTTDQSLNDQDWLRLVESSDIDVRNSDQYVMMGDVSYLGLANDLVGHDNGDALLVGISKKLQEHFGQAYRYGGDELTGVLNAKLPALLLKQERFNEEISRMTDLANLAEYHLAPNVDIGFAHISEAINLYKKMLDDDRVSGDLKSGVLRKLEDLWIMIADKRSYKVKAFKRIMLLIDRANRGQANEGNITKGAYSINEPELKELSDKQERGEDIGPDIERFINEKEIAKLDKISDELKRVQTEYVLRHLKFMQ